MAEKDKRYYWLKLKRDFFKRHDIRIIESMPNGKDYILFYLKLLCESVDHEGHLRFSEQIPYNEDMLATITNTNVDVVRTAIKVFTELKMMEIMDDGTYYMNEVNKMLGSETYWAQKKREQRLSSDSVGQFPTLSNEIPTCPSKSIDKDIEKDIDKDIEGEENGTPPPPPPPSPPPKPVKHKYGKYKHVLLTDEEITTLRVEYGVNPTEEAIIFLDEYIEMKGYKAKSHYLAIRKWVFDAVKEQEAKRVKIARQPQRTSCSYPEPTQQSYDELMRNFEKIKQSGEENERLKTAGNDEGVRQRAEDLKRRLG